MKAKKGLKNRIMTLLSVCTLIAALSPVVPVHAAETRQYDVVFRAGSHGSLSKQASTEIAVSQNGDTATVSVDYGNKLPITSGNILVTAESGYQFTGWSPDFDSTATVTKKAVYVAQYKKIIDEINYTVNYVDQDGNAVLTQKVVVCNKNEKNIIEEAPVIANYASPANSSVQVDTSKDGTVITFQYTVQPQEETIYQEETEYVPGTTTTNVVTQTTTGTTGTTTPGTTGTTDTTGTTTTPETTAPTEETGTTNIPDEEVPLAENPTENTEENQDQDTTTIEDEEVPLADKKVEKSNSKWIYSAIAGGGVLVLGAIALLVAKRRKM